MKKVFLVVLCVSLVAACLTGCGKNSEAKRAEEIISALGTPEEISIEKEEDINNAKVFYNLLTDKQKQEVENYEDLVRLENALVDLKVRLAEEAAEQKEAEEAARIAAEEKARKEAEAKVPPAPIQITNLGVEKNSIGYPEVSFQFTNTGNADVTAFTFLIKCYDAYGEQIISYNKYEYISVDYSDGVAVGKTTPSDECVQLSSGFKTTASCKIAISKYRLAGGSTVTIPESRLVWK